MRAAGRDAGGRCGDVGGGGGGGGTRILAPCLSSSNNPVPTITKTGTVIAPEWYEAFSYPGSSYYRGKVLFIFSSVDPFLARQRSREARRRPLSIFFLFLSFFFQRRPKDRNISPFSFFFCFFFFPPVYRSVIRESRGHSSSPPSLGRPPFNRVTSITFPYSCDGRNGQSDCN
jgi:hypothetical protein